jgi:hypothetical protein
VIAAGCGRLGFDERAVAGVDAPGADSATDAISVCTVAACPAGYMITDGGCYRLALTPRDWLAAELDCEADGGHLVVEDTVNEHYTLHDLAAGIPQIWIGWTDRRGPDNVFRWVAPVQGELQQGGNCVFPANEPDPGDGDHCVAQDGLNSCGDYNDLACTLALPYVCECDGNRADPTAY